MSKSKTRAARQSLARISAPTSAPAPSRWSKYLPTAASVRETIESVAIAFILAFFLRTFEVEAFVIPTGSMAPTLMGRHKDLVCPNCRYAFQVSASEEVEKDGSPKVADPDARDFHPVSPEDFLIDRCLCPMCGYEISWDPTHKNQYPSYSGDRILVNKFAYQFKDPKRWDVVVFKFPEGAQENYIKRLVGLPGETIRVRYGDIWVKGSQGNWQIQRKRPEKLRAMLQPVFDNDLMPALAEKGLPARWQAEPPVDGGKTGGWTTENFTEYQTDGGASGEVWLRYLHRLPPPWDAQQPPAADRIPPQLITDLTAYDTNSSNFGRRDTRVRNRCFAMHWVGDLALQCEVEVKGDQGAILFELVKGGRRFQCRIDVATGRATLSFSGPDEAQFHPQVETPLRGPGTYQVSFANCDQRLYLWVNEKSFAVADYGDLHNTRPQLADLQPVGIASRGAKVTVRHLKIFRDLYYIATQNQLKMCDYRDVPRLLYEGQDLEFFSRPEYWNAFDPGNMDSYEKSIPEDKFLVFGDNSAKSADSRVWGCVPRGLMLGQAFFIYWPHSWNRIPYLHIPFPFFPNFARMGFIR